jgi:hypothetical protein
MQKKVIYSLFGDERILIVDYLKSHYDWNPVFFLESQKMGEFAIKDYQDIPFQGITAFYQDNFNYSKLGRAVPIDAKIISVLSKYESNWMNMLADSTGWNFSFIERRRFYYDCLTYLNTMIHRLKPELFICYTWPHNIADYLLYLLCKHHYSIDVLFFDPIPHLDKYFFTVGCSLEDLSTPFKENYNLGQSDVSPETEEYISLIQSPEATIPVYVSDYYKRLDSREFFSYKGFARLLYMMLRGRAFKKAPDKWKKNRNPIDSPLSKMSFFDYFWFRERIRRQNRKLRKIYDKFTQQPDLNRKYLYFAAQYQPEAITSPNAGVYEDMFLAMDILSASVPKDCVIYYKEHPNTFKGGDWGAICKNFHYYKKVSSYNNIIMVPSEYSNFDLIDHSIAVSTACGTTGWEAVVRGIPAIVFGRCWYSACKSVFMVNTLNDVIEAVKKIENGYVPDQEDIICYAEAVYQSSYPKLIALDEFNKKLNESTNTAKYEMEQIAKVLYEAYERYYPSDKTVTQ